MKRKSLIQVTFSLILGLALIITTVVISPGVASAQKTLLTTASQYLQAGINAYDERDLNNAALYFEQAISETDDLEIKISALQRLAALADIQEDEESANNLFEQSLDLIDDLEIGEETKDCLSGCSVDGLYCPTNRTCDVHGSGIDQFCKPC